MTSLRFRLPGRVQSLGAWLTSLLPSIDRPGRRRLIEEGRIRLDGRVADRSTLDCPPGAIVEIEDLPDLVCEPSATGLHRSWQAIVDLPPWRFGALDIDPRSVLEFERVEVRGALARLVLSGEPCDAAAVCEGLARGSMPVVGDLARGGLGIAGGPRLAPLEGSTSDASLVWPEEETWRLDAHEEGAGEFVVSRETGRALRAGHPWILPDAASDPATRFRPGALVRVVDRESGPLGWAHVEAAPHLAARLWSLGASARRQIPSVEARVARAVARRRALWVDLAVGGTNAFRLVHGEGDGLPGLFVDRLGPLLRVLVTGWSCEGFRQRAVAALRSQLPVSPEGDPWSVLELLHLRRAGASRVGRVQWAEGGIESLEEAGFETIREGFFVEERGLRFFVDPGWDAPYQPRPGYGLFVDQRENRERLARFAAGGGAG
ncbi:MAG: hypothetical protein GY910_13570 [bacterium]|nr:hypothetical protein [bacterium]